MARKKSGVAWISCERSRRAIYQKRCEGLFKKAMDLCSVCGAEAAVAVFCQDEEPAFWPDKPSAVELYRRYVRIPAMERSKKMCNQDNFMKDSIARIKEQTRKCLKRSRETEMNDLLHQIVSENRMCELPISDLTRLMEFLKEMDRETRNRTLHLQELPPLFGNGTIPPSSSLSSSLLSLSSSSGLILFSTPEGSTAPSGGFDTEGADKGIVDKKLVNYIGWDEIGMPQQYKDLQGLPKGNSDMEFSQGNSTRNIPTAQEDIWLPVGNIGGGGFSTGGIQMESLIGSTDLPINEMGSQCGFNNIVTSSRRNQMRLPHGNSCLAAGREMHLPYGRGGGNITDFLMVGINQLGLPYGISDSFAGGNEMGVPHGNSTSVTASVGNEAGLPTGNSTGGFPTGKSTGGHQMGDEMGQQLSYEDVVGASTEVFHADVGPGLPGAASSNGMKIMGLPQENVASSSGGNKGGQQYDDVNYDAWFESLGV